MTPLIFILLVSTILILLVYWVLSTLGEEESRKDPGSYKFEAAPEIGPYVYMPSNHPFSMAEENKIILSRLDSRRMIANWNITSDKWEEKFGQIREADHSGNIILRIFYSDKGTKSYDILVKSLAGSYDFECLPDTSYYVVLGTRHEDNFIPFFFSNAVISPPRNIKH